MSSAAAIADAYGFRPRVYADDDEGTLGAAGCATDSDCDAGNQCVGGLCIPTLPSVPGIPNLPSVPSLPTLPGGCATDSDCGAGSQCTAGVCLPITGAISAATGVAGGVTAQVSGLWGGLPAGVQLPSVDPNAILNGQGLPLTPPTADQIQTAATLQANAQLRAATGGMVDVSTLLAVAGLTPGQVQGMASSAFSQMSAGAQAQFSAMSSPQAANQRAIAGAQAAANLLQNGYDPSNEADNQQLIAAIAGAVSLIPGVGPMLGAAILVLDAIGEAVAQILEAVGLIWFGCRSSGTWTGATIGAAYQSPSMPKGSFASFAYPALLQNGVQNALCKSSLNSLAVLAACANFWNQHCSGPPIGVYVPAMWGGGNGLPYPFPFAKQVASAFQPAATLKSVGDFANWAIKDNALDPTVFAEKDPNNTLDAVNVGGIISGGDPHPPCILQLQGSIFVPPSAAPPTSTAVKVVGTSAAVAVVGVGAWAALGQPLSVSALKLALGFAR